MALLKDTPFICLDCEFTGLDPENDRIIEIAAARFTLSGVIETIDLLVNPGCPISPESYAIHHISEEMVLSQPSLESVLPEFFAFVGKDVIVGHAIRCDLDMLEKAASRAEIPFPLKGRPAIDTLRLARLYGDSPNNSLQTLASHFNVENPGSHRALNDVMMNIEVFKHLVRKYKTVDQIFDTLSQPIRMKYMPLGKHKGRLFSEIPFQYLQWAAHMDFDQDLLFTIRLEVKKRKKGDNFGQAANPFAEL